jgi:diguanylate cyclase (GGDEF)-like protein/PAS domain S-box-containing protein/putative nucleotidyltransferase with HDIG domain
MNPTVPCPPPNAADDSGVPPEDGAACNGDRHVAHIADLLQSLEAVASESGLAIPPARSSDQTHENQLVLVRLGLAAALHTALRWKHAPSASHALRVAIGCSNWAMALGLSDEDRDRLEVAALLHDIGKIGVPDFLLTKPGRLLPEEIDIIDRHREMAADILSNCGAPAELIATVVASAAWFDGTHRVVPLSGEQIPLAARMLAIVDAFDAMTTDHVYRPAKSRERALAELFHFAGTQFDPELAQDFSEAVSRDQSILTKQVASRWLADLATHAIEFPWQPSVELAASECAVGPPLGLFRSKVIDNMHDGVVFVDCQRRVLFWNTGMERITGVSGAAATGRLLAPSLLDMTDEYNVRIADVRCPTEAALTCGVQALHRVTVLGRNGRRVRVNLHVVPVRGDDGTPQGAAMLFHDATSEVSLEERCQTLYAQATKDPLTKVANRAEFDRVLALFIEAHLETGFPCSLIMADIDFFKRINDTHGHQVGDEAIIAFAEHLKSMCRSGDLVARYGGEEFAVLCADCNNATAARRAESIRKSLAERTHRDLGNRGFTASFGVTELQLGDKPETMLRRADRALLQAKDQGRNQVVQLGEGMMAESPKKKWWPFGSFSLRGQALVESTLITNVPIEIAIQKLRGFIADHTAKIAKISENEIRLESSDKSAVHLRRRNDRPLDFVIEMKFVQEHHERTNSLGFAAGSYVQTKVIVTIRTRRDRDRRLSHATERARLVLASVKSYLMAKEEAVETIFSAR